MHRFSGNLYFWPFWPIITSILLDGIVKTLTAKEAKYGFGRLIDLARTEPVVVAKHGRPVVVVMSVEEYALLTSTQNAAGPKSPRSTNS